METSAKWAGPKTRSTSISRNGKGIGSLGERGIYKGGEPLSDEGRVPMPDGTITDSPLVKAKELIGGLVILNVDSFETAIAEVRSCPLLEAGGKIEIREGLEGPCADHAHQAATVSAIS